MTEAELDRYLDAWQAPKPPASLREGLRARFPRAERRTFARPLRWGLAIAILTVALAGLAQTGPDLRDNPVFRVLSGWYTDFVQAIETRQAAGIRNQIRESHPQVYVDGLRAGSLEYGPAARMDVAVPDEGVYSFVTYSLVAGRGGWIETGRIQGNVIEFQAGSRHVRIVCDKPIVDTDRPVFVRRRP